MAGVACDTLQRITIKIETQVGGCKTTTTVGAAPSAGGASAQEGWGGAACTSMRLAGHSTFAPKMFIVGLKFSTGHSLARNPACAGYNDDQGGMLKWKVQRSNFL